MTKILRVLFYVSLIAFPFGQVLRLQLPYNINVTFFDLCVLLTGVFWLGMVSYRTNRFKVATLSKPMLLFLLAIIISLIANSMRYAPNDFFVACLYAVRWLLFVSIYFVIFEFPDGVKKRLPDLLTLSGGVVVVFGYLQYFLYANLRNLYYLGWDEHLARMFSSFLDPNFFGAFLVLYLLLLASQLERSAMEKQQMKMSVYGLFAVGTFIAIFLTTSRSAIVMLIVTACMYLILSHKTKWILGFIGVLAIIFIFASRFFYIENVNPFRVASSVARVESALDAVSVIQKNAIIGVGFNAYRYAQYEYGLRMPDTTYPNHADSSTDNSLLFVFATTGIIGLSAYGYLLYRIICKGSKTKSIHGKLLIVSTIGLIVDSLFINSLFYPLLMFWLWTLVGLTDYT